MAMERWRHPSVRPWRTSTMLDDMERLMNESFAGWPIRAMWRRLPDEEIGWAPSLEMYEKDESFIVKAELPGVNKDDIDISITGDTLTIKGERKASEEVKQEQYHRCEVCYGSFSRSIMLPSAVNPQKIEAVYEDGILEIRVPKVAELKPARIKIKSKSTQQGK